MSSLESSSSQGGIKTYLCRHTCGCKLRHSTEFTRSSVSSQGALWYHEHNDTLHPKHNLDCEYERYKNTRKIKDSKDKIGKEIKHDKLLFQSYQKNAMGDDQFKRKASLQEDQSNKRIRVAMDGITYPNQYPFDETQFLKAEIKELQEQIDFLKLQYIEQFLPKDKVDNNNYLNNINLLKRVVPQFLHDIWFKNCKNTTEYQKRIIEILTTIIEFFDPDNNKSTSSPSLANNGNENVQNMMNPGHIMTAEGLSKPAEEAPPVVEAIIKDPLNHTITNTVGAVNAVSAVNAVNAVNAINAVGQAIENNHFITNPTLNDDDLSNTNSSTIVANNIETLEGINETAKNAAIINIEAPEIVNSAEAKAAELAAAAAGAIKLDPTNATSTIDLTATLGSIKDDDAAATLNNTINELSQKTSIINTIQLSTQMAQAAPAAVKPETTLVATAIQPSFTLQANEIDVMKK